MIRKALLHKVLVLAVFGLVASSNAFLLDQAKIVISRALSSPTITVKYNGASAALAELRVNGVSYSTRNLDSTKSQGETNFSLEMSALKEGDNEIEIRLFSKSGKLIGTERQLVVTESSFEAPVFIRSPKMGATVFGSVDVQVGFGKNMRNTYVSFFVDNQFKSMSNVAPYSYVWDSEREQNGWHEIEAWIVDDNNQTLKTKKVRVFVNNPGGSTERILAGGSNSANVTIGTGAPKAGSKNNAPKVKPPIAKNVPAEMGNEVKGQVSNATGLKPIKVDAPVPTSAQLLTPTGKRIGKKPEVKPIVAITNDTPKVIVKPTEGLIPITKGMRLPDVKNFSVVVNDRIVEFDVQPRVEKGVPLTPFRHLFEQAGGEVNWNHKKKQVDAKGMGKEILITIGDMVAMVNGMPISMELAPFIEKGRTIVPMSFIKDSLDVNVDYDKATGHVLITQTKKD